MPITSTPEVIKVGPHQINLFTFFPSLSLVILLFTSLLPPFIPFLPISCLQPMKIPCFTRPLTLAQGL